MSTQKLQDKINILDVFYGEKLTSNSYQQVLLDEVNGRIIDEIISIMIDGTYYDFLYEEKSRTIESFKDNYELLFSDKINALELSESSLISTCNNTYECLKLFRSFLTSLHESLYNNKITYINYSFEEKLYAIKWNEIYHVSKENDRIIIELKEDKKNEDKHIKLLLHLVAAKFDEGYVCDKETLSQLLAFWLVYFQNMHRILVM